MTTERKRVFVFSGIFIVVIVFVVTGIIRSRKRKKRNKEIDELIESQLTLNKKMMDRFENPPPANPVPAIVHPQPAQQPAAPAQAQAPKPESE